MSTEKSLSSRVTRLRQLKNANGAGAITAAEPIPGEWPQHSIAFLASYAQSRLWFLHQLEPQLTAYHIPMLWRLRGDLDYKALQQAFFSLIERHPTLRTSFQLHGSDVVQILHSAELVQLVPVPLDARDAEAVIEQWLQQESTTPFDLSSGLLIRMRLLHVADQEHLLLINHHHIASDGWSQSVLTRDLTELYNARRSGQPPQLQRLKVRYQDYATWQRQRLSVDRLQTLKSYWIPQLTGIEPLELPSDHPRPATPSHKGSSVAFQITPELLAPFEKFCRSEGATLQMGLLALVSLLLHRYSRQDDFAIGIPIWGRNHPDLEPLIGFFVNTLPIRIRFDHGQTFRQVLRQVRTTSLEAYDHQELPFEQIIEALNLPRDASRNPLVQVMLQLKELPDASLNNLEGLEVEPVAGTRESSKLDLSFDLRRSHNQGLNATISYAVDLFSEDRIQHLSEHLLTLLGSSLEAPDSSTHSLNLIPHPERQLIDYWQQGPSIDIPDLCVHQLFEQQVECTPHAISLIFEDQQLTYKELNARANQLAHHLIDLGVGPEIIVAVCLERSIELIVSLLAILKAGGAYLPLDPSSPDEHLRRVLKQTKIQIIINNQAINANKQRGFAHVVNTFEIEKRKDINAFTIQNPTIKALNKNNLAYAIFTSGSTGKPKGIEISHESMTIKCLSICERWSLAPGIHTLALSSPAFDIFLRETIFPLTSGCTAVLVTEDARRAPRELAKTAQKFQVSRIQATPSHWNELIASDIHKGNSIQVIAIGETLNPEIAEKLCHPSQTSLLHLYGTTEAPGSTGISYGEKVWTDHVSIGKPLEHSIIKILTNELTPCPIGVPGELHIGGAGIARGYLNNPELTAEKFIHDPFSDDPSARLYKSGDLASWNPDGTLAFHGRLDHQIKLRGFRIEPMEIETNLIAHPHVARATVLLNRDDPDSPCLIAYWSTQADDPSSNTSQPTRPSAEQLRAFLSDRLPDYMIPAAFIQLQTFPLTPNGKLDHKALPAPSFSGNHKQRVAPSTQLERQLHDIWAEVLGHSDFGITDNFFAIGGHSLLTMQVSMLVRDQLDRDPPAYSFFSCPTIQEFISQYIDDFSDSANTNRTESNPKNFQEQIALPHPIERALLQQRLFLAHWAGQLSHGHQFVRMLGNPLANHQLFWCFQGSHEHQSLAKHLAPEVAVYGMRSLRGTDYREVIYKSPALLALLAGLYGKEVMALADPSASLVVGGNCQSAKVAYALAELLVSCGSSVGRLILMEIRLQQVVEGQLDWEGPVHLIWGEGSAHNPFSSAHRPSSAKLLKLKEQKPQTYKSVIISRLRQAFTGRLEISIVPGIHGAFFRSENIEGLASAVKRNFKTIP